PFVDLVDVRRLLLKRLPLDQRLLVLRDGDDREAECAVFSRGLNHWSSSSSATNASIQNESRRLHGQPTKFSASSTSRRAARARTAAETGITRVPPTAAGATRGIPGRGRRPMGGLRVQPARVRPGPEPRGLKT